MPYKYWDTHQPLQGTYVPVSHHEDVPSWHEPISEADIQAFIKSIQGESSSEEEEDEEEEIDPWLAFLIDQETPNTPPEELGNA